MDPVMQSVCEERHERIDERCDNHHSQIEVLFEKFDCLKRGQDRVQWLLIGVLIALIADIIRGMVVLDNVTKLIVK